MKYRLLVLTCIMGLLSACQSTPPVNKSDTTATDTTNSQSSTTPDSPYAADALTNPDSPLSKRSIYFDFDSSAIRNEFRPLIQDHSNYLKAMSSHNIQIQGNTDVRGSREYNLALGQKRSESVRQSMLLLGVPDSQIEAVSFGKEKPRALGNQEQDHAQNRRADIVYDGESSRK